MEKTLKELRVKLDGLMRLSMEINKALPEDLIRITGHSRQKSLSITSLELSKMWLSKTLEAYGAANPYPESKDPLSSKIEPIADVNQNSEPEEWKGFDYIAKVKYLRSEITKTEVEIVNLWLDNKEDSIKIQISLECSYKSCIEASMWLGAELGRIKSLESSDTVQRQ